MKRILSIDFDYYLDTDIDTRNNKFPDGVDSLPADQLKEQWEYFYSTYQEIKRIGVIEDFYRMCMSLKYWYAQFSKEGRKTKVIIANSHKHIEKCFEDYTEDFFVMHIDFHHDCYISGGETLDCANWVRILKDKRPNSEVKWVRREDSETISLAGEYPYESSTEYCCHHNFFDYIFICFSPEWTPPHLLERFKFMVESCSRFDDIEFIEIDL